jgi:hypothetical protein
LAGQGCCREYEVLAVQAITYIFIAKYLQGFRGSRQIIYRHFSGVQVVIQIYAGKYKEVFYKSI